MQLFASAEIEFARIGPIGCWGWKLHAFLFASFDYIFDSSNQLPEYISFVIAVYAATKKTRRTPNVAVVFIRPVNQFQVLIACFHLPTKAINSRTMLIW